MATTMFTGWVTEDGTYGFGKIIIFGMNELTPMQWDELSDAADSDKMLYVQAATRLAPSLKEKLEKEGYKFE